MQLFPNIIPYGAHRVRANDSLKKIGQVATRAFKGDSTEEVASDPTFLFQELSFKEYLNVEYKAFDSWESWFGPHTFHGDKFTSLTRLNVSEPSHYAGSINTDNVSGLRNDSCTGQLHRVHLPEQYAQRR